MKYLVDTCVLSELARRNPSSRVLDWFDGRKPTDVCYVSAVTVGELKQGVAALPDEDPRKAKLTQWLERRVLRQYADRIVDYDVSVAKRWGEIMGASRRMGCTHPDLDTQIAATALSHGMTMVTRNVGDFQFEGLSIVNPFEAGEGPSN